MVAPATPVTAPSPSPAVPVVTPTAPVATAPVATTPSPPAVATPVTSVPTATAAVTPVTAPIASTTVNTTVTPVTESFQSSAYLKQQEVNYSQPQPQPQQMHQQHMHHQQQQQSMPQQQFGGMDHLTSAYSSYLPNQPPTGVSGFGMNPMGNLPDYGIYGTEAQRAAAMVRFFFLLE